MDEYTLKQAMGAKNLTILDGSVESRVADCMEAVKLCVQPASRWDHVGLRRFGRWLEQQVLAEAVPVYAPLRRERNFPFDKSLLQVYSIAHPFKALLGLRRPNRKGKVEDE